MPQDCQICHNSLFDEKENGDFIVTLKVCGHCFHNACALEWITRSGTCPQCRRECHKGDLLKVFLSQQEDNDGASGGDTVNEKPVESPLVRRIPPPVPPRTKPVLYPRLSIESEERKLDEEEEKAFNKGWTQIEELVTDTVESWDNQNDPKEPELQTTDEKKENFIYNQWKQIESLVSEVSQVAINSWTDYLKMPSKVSNESTELQKSEELYGADCNAKPYEWSTETATYSQETVQGWVGNTVYPPKTEMVPNHGQNYTSCAESVPVEMTKDEIKVKVKLVKEKKKVFKEIVNNYKKDIKAEFKRQNDRNRALQKQHKHVSQALELQYRDERALMKIKEPGSDQKLLLKKLRKEHKQKMDRLKLDQKLELTQIHEENERKISELVQNFNDKIKELYS